MHETYEKGILYKNFVIKCFSPFFAVLRVLRGKKLSYRLLPFPVSRLMPETYEKGILYKNFVIKCFSPFFAVLRVLRGKKTVLPSFAFPCLPSLLRLHAHLIPSLLLATVECPVGGLEDGTRVFLCKDVGNSGSNLDVFPGENRIQRGEI